jgi:hypothetical protein
VTAATSSAVPQLRDAGGTRTAWAAAILAIHLLAACGDNRQASGRIPPQRWKDLQVEVETQPNPPRAGADEILVILAAPRGVSTYDCIVWLRTGEADPWVQAIQDGHSGVYRRVVQLEPPQRSTLHVRISRQNEQGELRFAVISTTGG